MIGMGVWGVMMIVVVMVIMRMVMSMVVVVPMMMVMIHIQPTRPGAKRIAQLAIFDVRSRGRCALPFDVMMMAFLWHPHLGFKSQNLCAIFAHGTIHHRLTV